MDTLNKILIILATISVIFFIVTVYDDVYTNNLMCYNPDVKIGFTQGQYQQMHDCNYNGDQWVCDEGTFTYCH